MATEQELAKREAKLDEDLKKLKISQDELAKQKAQLDKKPTLTTSQPKSAFKDGSEIPKEETKPKTKEETKEESSEKIDDKKQAESKE